MPSGNGELTTSDAQPSLSVHACHVINKRVGTKATGSLASTAIARGWLEQGWLERGESDVELGIVYPTQSSHAISPLRQSHFTAVPCVPLTTLSSCSPLIPSLLSSPKKNDRAGEL